MYDTDGRGEDRMWEAEATPGRSAREKIEAIAKRVRGNPYMDHISSVDVKLTAAEILALDDFVAQFNLH